MDPSEVDFLSEKQHVKILPNFKEGRIFLISVGVNCLNDRENIY
jgi:hypothetical protein